MPRKLSNRSMVATLLGLLIAVPAAVLTMATPASADNAQCCQAAITNMPGQFQAGGDPKPFTLRIVNRMNDSLRYVNATFTLQANGLSANQVHLQRQRVLGGPRSIGARNQHGQITANDSIDLGALALPPGGSVSIQYKLSFGQKAPGSRLSISVRVQPRRSDASSVNAGPYASTILAYGVATKPTPTHAATPSPTPSLSDTPTAADTDAGAIPTGDSTVLGGDSPGGNGSLMWLVYTIGALLLLGGIGVIGTMLYRRGPRGVETDWDDQGQPQYGQPTYPGTGGYAPTQVAGFGVPTPAMPAQAATTSVMPASYGPPGRHSAPTSQYPAPQDPYSQADQTWVDRTQVTNLIGERRSVAYEHRSKAEALPGLSGGSGRRVTAKGRSPVWESAPLRCLSGSRLVRLQPSQRPRYAGPPLFPGRPRRRRRRCLQRSQSACAWC